MYSPYSSIYSYTPKIGPELQFLMPIINAYLVIFGGALILGLISYILRGIAICKMSENRKIDNGWLGFIPVAWKYQLGILAGEVEFGNKKIKNTGLLLILMPILFGTVFVVGYLATMIPFLIRAFALSDTPSVIAFEKIFTSFFTGLFIFILVLIVVQIFWYLIRYLALHKIFSRYSTGQKPVFYLIIAMFVPLAESILLFIHRDKPLIEFQEEIVAAESITTDFEVAEQDNVPPEE